jgi:selenocysteine lyase/cysteine desulfurase
MPTLPFLTVSSPNRREFLSTIGAGAVAGIGWQTPPSWSRVVRQLAPDAPPFSGDFLFTPGVVYLTTATMGPCSRHVVEETTRAWYQMETIPSIMGSKAAPLLTAVERVRQQGADLLGCTVDEVVVTKSTTDGMNMIAQGLRLTSGQRVLISDQEHDGGTSGWKYLAKRDGIRIDIVSIPIGVNDAAAIVASFAAAITPDTRVISVSDVLTSTGLRMPIAELSALAKSRGILCVVDGAQAAGGVKVDVKALGCHAYATSGHKWLMGPKGTGLLYLAKGTEEIIVPMQLQGGRACYSASTGVGNFPGIAGLGVAIQALATSGIAAVDRHNLRIRNRFYDELQQLPKVTVVSAPPGPLASQLITFKLPDSVDSQLMTKTLHDKYKVVVKMVPKQWLNGIRLSPHVFNTEAEVDLVIWALRTELE